VWAAGVRSEKGCSLKWWMVDDWRVRSDESVAPTRLESSSDFTHKKAVNLDED